jgi:hypothetical protein
VICLVILLVRNDKSDLLKFNKCSPCVTLLCCYILQTVNTNYYLVSSLPVKYITRACLFLCFVAISLSDDHKPNRKDEQTRIENAGGSVSYDGKSP